MATESYSKSLPKKLNPYYIRSSTTKTLTIDEKRVRNTISFDRASLTLQSEITASATGQDPSRQLQNSEGGLKCTYSQICQWVLMILSGGLLQVSLKPQTRTKSTQILIMRNVPSKAPSALQLHDRPHCPSYNQRCKYSICHKVVTLYNSRWYHRSECRHTTEVYHMVSLKKAEAKQLKQ